MRVFLLSLAAIVPLVLLVSNFEKPALVDRYPQESSALSPVSNATKVKYDLATIKSLIDDTETGQLVAEYKMNSIYRSLDVIDKTNFEQSPTISNKQDLIAGIESAPTSITTHAQLHDFIQAYEIEFQSDRRALSKLYASLAVLSMFTDKALSLESVKKATRESPDIKEYWALAAQLYGDHGKNLESAKTYEYIVKNYELSDLEFDSMEYLAISRFFIARKYDAVERRASNFARRTAYREFNRFMGLAAVIRIEAASRHSVDTELDESTLEAIILKCESIDADLCLAQSHFFIADNAFGRKDQAQFKKHLGPALKHLESHPSMASSYGRALELQLIEDYSAVDLSGALNTAERLIKVADKNDDFGRKMFGHFNKAYVFMVSGKFDEMRVEIDILQAGVDKVAESKYKGPIMMIVGQYEELAGRMSNSVTKLRIAYEYCRDNPQANCLNSTSMAYARVLFATNQYELALPRLHWLRENIEEPFKRVRLSKVNIWLGIIAYDQQRFNDAKKFLEQGTDNPPAEADKSILAAGIFQLGHTLYKLGDAEGALMRFDNAKDHFEALEMPDSVKEVDRVIDKLKAIMASG